MEVGVFVHISLYHTFSFCSSSSCPLIRAYWPTFLMWHCLLHWEDACLTATKPGWISGWSVHQVGLEGYGYSGNLGLWKTGYSGLESWKLGASSLHIAHVLVCSQRLETLQQNCQETCALIQGVIDSMKAMQQPMESGVSVALLISLNAPQLPFPLPCSLMSVALNYRKLVSCYSRCNPSCSRC